MRERTAEKEWNERMIKSLCGAGAYRKGETLFRAGKAEVRRFTEEGSGVYEAFVRDGDTLRLTLRFGSDDGIAAQCECSAGFAFERCCKHTAAALLQLLQLRREGLLNRDDAEQIQPNQAENAEIEQAGRTDYVVERESERSDEESLTKGDQDERSHSNADESKASDSFDVGRSDSSSGDRAEHRLVGRVMDLFRQQPRALAGSRSIFESRQELSVEFWIVPYPHGPRRGLLGVELRVGLTRTYAVPDIREFLTRFERGERYSFSRHFTYDPADHCFGMRDDAVLLRLAEIRRSEKIQRASAGALYTGEIGDPPSLPLPPHAWEGLVSLLEAVPKAGLRAQGRTHSGIAVSKELLPLRFEFDRGQAGSLRMHARGMDETTVLESYGLTLNAGVFYRIGSAEARRLAELKQILAAGADSSDVDRDRDTVDIPEPHIRAFMERVVPGLMKMGDVFFAGGVSDQVVQIPLAARVYLDRVHDRLLAGLEFQYGDIVINPLERGGERRGESRILVREGGKELQILELMEQAGFIRTEAGYYMQDEEREFAFLHGIVPHLEKIAKVYATTSVKERVIRVSPPPKISAALDGRSNWLEFHFAIEGIPEAEIRSAVEALLDKRKYYRLRSGALLPLETQAFRTLTEFLNGHRPFLSEEDASSFRLPVAEGLHLLHEYAEGPDSLMRPDRALRRLLDSLRSPDLLDFPVPESLAPALRDYQQTGYRWLKTLAHYRLGGVLADDMGLGKTVQSIAYLLSVMPEIRESGRPALIAAPASLLYNWRSELERFAPQLRALIADGSKAEREALLSPEHRSDADVLIVSYPLLRRDLPHYERMEFHTLVLDEAQAIKNADTQTAKAVKSLRAGFRFALTGTPIENALDELRSIFDAVLPGLYPNRRKFAELTRETVAKRARPFLLRRLKVDVLGELPEKIESVRVTELLPEQKRLYAGQLAKLRYETLKHLDNSEELGRSRIRFLAGLTRLRQICCHPALFVEGYEGRSAKFEQLLETLEECRRAGRRVLVFSQFTEMLGLIGRELGYREMPFFYLDGHTPPRERLDLCEQFNEGEKDIFLISLKAGGTGLNLTGADTVILYDLWWNPAVERQAEDRAHRMGQTRVVQVIRLVARGTVEEKMHELQQKKMTLIDDVITPGEDSLTSLTDANLLELLETE